MSLIGPPPPPRGLRGGSKRYLFRFGRHVREFLEVEFDTFKVNGCATLLGLLVRFLSLKKSLHESV